jgi:hypothetical protein
VHVCVEIRDAGSNGEMRSCKSVSDESEHAQDRQSGGGDTRCELWVDRMDGDERGGIEHAGMQTPKWQKMKSTNARKNKRR